jgi:hypothetical protein
VRVTVGERVELHLDEFHGREQGGEQRGRDVALLATDYRALADGSRTLPQVDGEVRTSFGRVVDYRNLICLTEEERQKQAGN